MGHIINGFNNSGIWGENHVGEMIGKVIYTFHMPLFMSISGYVFALAYVRNCNIRIKGIRKQVCNLFIVYFLFSIIYFLIRTPFANLMVTEYTWLDLLKLPYKAIGVYWYIYVLAFLYLIMLWTVKIPYKVLLTVSMIICFMYNI